MLGIKFKLVTDCDSFRLTLSKSKINPRIARWAMILQEFTFTVEHRPGKKMGHVDALSRCYSVLVLEANSFDRTLALSQDRDPEIVAIRKRLEKSEEKFYELRNGLVYRKENEKLLFVVPEAMIENVIRANHDDLGHIGCEKVLENMLKVYWFPGARRRVKEHIEACLRCVEFSPESGKKEHCSFSHCARRSPWSFRENWQRISILADNY